MQETRLDLMKHPKSRRNLPYYSSAAVDVTLEEPGLILVLNRRIKKKIVAPVAPQSTFVAGSLCPLAAVR